jgi:hypothetical protein
MAKPPYQHHNHHIRRRKYHHRPSRSPRHHQARTLFGKRRTVVISLFNYNELQWKEWTAASMALHQAMINSIGALNLATIERLSGHAGIISLSCR